MSSASILINEITPTATWSELPFRPVQCAAVATWYSFRMMPEHLWRPESKRATCQGTKSASLPPTIRRRVPNLHRQSDLLSDRTVLDKQSTRTRISRNRAGIELMNIFFSLSPSHFSLLLKFTRIRISNWNWTEIGLPEDRSKEAPRIRNFRIENQVNNRWWCKSYTFLVENCNLQLNHQSPLINVERLRVFKH